MSRIAIQSDLPIPLSGKQKVALMLDKAGYTDQQIADRMGMKRRETANRLVQRAKKRAAEFHRAVQAYVGAGNLMPAA